MFSTGISYDEAISAIQKLDSDIREDYEKEFAYIRKAESIYAEEDGRQIIGYMSLAFILPLIAHSLSFSPLLAVVGSIAFSAILSLIGIVYTYGISERLGKNPDFYLLHKSSQKVKLAFFVLLPLMVETIYRIIEYFRR